jgi:calcineurin-like phosphoesterase family protein
MSVFFTADQHLGHERIIELCKRPFADLEEMHAEIVRRWNDRVERSDDVYVLGDFALYRDEKILNSLFGKLKGRKHLIRGNHDPKQVERLPWSSHVTDRREIKIDGRHWVLDHYSMRSWHRSSKGSIHAFGHSHGNLPPYGRSEDVGVDMWNFAPTTPQEVLDRIEARGGFDAPPPD